jgi:hypothetical protein
MVFRSISNLINTRERLKITKSAGKSTGIDQLENQNPK